MTRIIKFRAWDKKKNIIRQISMLETDSDLGIRYQAQYYVDGGDHTYRSDIEIMQFTGVTDKKGTEIYEGDILLWTARDNDGSIMKQTDVVKYERGCFMVGDECLCDQGNYDQVCKQSKVIGNIYENPELLK